MPDNNTLIAAATPVFFLLIAIEAVLAHRRGLDAYVLADSLTSLGCGVWTVTLEVFSKGALLLAYAWLADRAPFKPWPADDWRTWAVFFLALDFLYYWAHRWSHEINALWGGHAPHHQSEEFNYTTALRQGAFQDALHMPVFLPLTLLGCPAGVFIVLLTFSKFYQFWIHTRLIGRLGPLEGVLNTPRAHRVHHAVNDVYLDRNYGGTLMLWDRCFGTWAEENEACVYGVRKGMPGWDPVAAQFTWFGVLWRDARRARRWRDRLGLWGRRTGWRPADVEQADPQAPFALPAARQQAPARTGAWRWLAVAALALAAAFNQLLLARAAEPDWSLKLLLAVGVTLALLLMAWALRPAAGEAASTATTVLPES